MNCEEVNHEHRRTKRYVVAFTLIYLFLLPLFSGMALFSPMIFDNPSMTEPVGLTIIAMMIAVPIIMLTCVISMWSQYFGEQYKKARFRAVLPLMVIAVYLVLFILLQELFL